MIEDFLKRWSSYWKSWEIFISCCVLSFKHNRSLARDVTELCFPFIPFASNPSRIQYFNVLIFFIYKKSRVLPFCLLLRELLGEKEKRRFSKSGARFVYIHPKNYFNNYKIHLARKQHCMKSGYRLSQFWPLWFGWFWSRATHNSRDFTNFDNIAGWLARVLWDICTEPVALFGLALESYTRPIYKILYQSKNAKSVGEFVKTDETELRAYEMAGGDCNNIFILLDFGVSFLCLVGTAEKVCWWIFVGAKIWTIHCLEN